MIIALVETLRNLDSHLQIGEFLLNDSGNLDDLLIFKAEVKGLAVNLCCLNPGEHRVEVNHIRHTDVGSPLFPSVHRDEILAYGVGRELIYREIESLAGRYAANRRRSDIDGTEVG